MTTIPDSDLYRYSKRVKDKVVLITGGLASKFIQNIILISMFKAVGLVLEKRLHSALRHLGKWTLRDYDWT